MAEANQRIIDSLEFPKIIHYPAYIAVMDSSNLF